MSGRVLLAMSGGVDSSVAAWLLQQQGYEIVGLFMRTGVHADGQSCGTGKVNRKGCCSSLDAADARAVADRLGIPFYALDFETEFQQIIDYFVDEYASGRTPNPCVMCNNWLKFGKLWSIARDLDLDFVATGHYAQVRRGKNEAELHRAIDMTKDQSYVLWGMPRAMLDRVLFPIGGYAKSQIRRLAEEADLPVYAKPDSQEICFVPDGDYKSLIRQRRPELVANGTIEDPTGRVLGHHDGVFNFTIGQRKKLGVAAGRRRFVLQIIPEENRVIVGDRDQCRASGLIAEQVNWLIAPPTSPMPCQVKIRYRSQPVPATVELIGAGRVRVDFDEPQQAVTPGQSAVFYAGSRVLGGGWIESTCPAISLPR